MIYLKDNREGVDAEVKMLGSTIEKMIEVEDLGRNDGQQVTITTDYGYELVLCANDVGKILQALEWGITCRSQT